MLLTDHFNNFSSSAPHSFGPTITDYINIIDISDYVIVIVIVKVIVIVIDYEVSLFLLITCESKPLSQETRKSITQIVPKPLRSP